MAGTLTVFTPEAVPRSGPLDRVEPPAPDRRAGPRRFRSQLRDEDAPVRVTTGGCGSACAPPSFFDDEAPHRIPREWRPAARTVAEASAGFLETGLHRVCDRSPAARGRALAAAGRVEPRGGDPRRGSAGAGIRLADAAAPP